MVLNYGPFYSPAAIMRPYKGPRSELPTSGCILCNKVGLKSVP